MRPLRRILFGVRYSVLEGCQSGLMERFSARGKRIEISNF